MKELGALIDQLHSIELADGIISVYSSPIGNIWRIHLDQATFLRDVLSREEFEVWKVTPRTDETRPLELVSVIGNVEVFCLVKELPA